MLDLVIAPLAVLSVATALHFASAATLAAKPAALLIVLGTYAVLAAIAFYRMYRDGTLLDIFRWRSGDIARGAAIALVLIACVYVGKKLVVPGNTPSEAWLIRIYLQLGEPPAERTRFLLVGLGVLAIAALEEVVWRGMVQQILEERLGVRAGWLIGTLFYGLAHVPTLWQLDMPPVGKNPLVMLVALFCGFVWSFLTGRLQRLPPSLVSHCFFSYAMTMQFRLWSL